ERTRVRDLRLGKFALFKISIALRDEFLFSNVGVPRTGRQDERDKKKKADSGSEDVMGQHGVALHNGVALHKVSCRQYRHGIASATRVQFYAPGQPRGECRTTRFLSTVFLVGYANHDDSY